MSEKKRWVVTSSGERSLGDIKKDLTDSGFVVKEEFDAIGSMIGEADDDIAERLRAVTGVADVSPEPSVDIGPPDAPVTW